MPNFINRAMSGTIIVTIYEDDSFMVVGPIASRPIYPGNLSETSESCSFDWCVKILSKAKNHSTLVPIDFAGSFFPLPEQYRTVVQENGLDPDQYVLWGYHLMPQKLAEKIDEWVDERENSAKDEYSAAIAKNAPNVFEIRSYRTQIVCAESFVGENQFSKRLKKELQEILESDPRSALFVEAENLTVQRPSPDPSKIQKAELAMDMLVDGADIEEVRKVLKQAQEPPTIIL